MFLLNKHPRLLVLFFACLVIFFSVRSIFLSQAVKLPSEMKEAIDIEYRLLAWEAAEVVKRLNSDSYIVVLVVKSELAPSNKGNFKQIFRALESGGSRIMHVEELVQHTERGWMVRSGFPYSEYLRVARKYPNAGAIVSLLGLPYGEGVDKTLGAEGLPPLLLTRVDSWSQDLQGMLDDGRVLVAVVPREGKPGEGADMSSFDARYEVLVSRAK